MLSSPRLSPRFRVPGFLPPSSCKGSRSPRAAAIDIEAVAAARLASIELPPARQLISAANAGDVEDLKKLLLSGKVYSAPL